MAKRKKSSKSKRSDHMTFTQSLNEHPLMTLLVLALIAAFLAVIFLSIAIKFKYYDVNPYIDVPMRKVMITPSPSVSPSPAMRGYMKY